MTAIEVALLLIGVVFILGSFFIIEKLSPTELTRVAELSEEELRMVLDRELDTAGAKISDMADQAVDLSLDQIERRLEKDTNEKIMAISEYSDSVMEKLDKINKEVTFLYSMLGDKHTEINESMTQLNGLIQECQAVKIQTLEALQQHQELSAGISERMDFTETETTAEDPARSEHAEDAAEGFRKDQTETADEENNANVREKILERYHAGENLTDVARDLGLGYGEVKLIVELYKGEENQ